MDIHIGVYFNKECDFWVVLVRYIGELNILARKMRYTKTLRFHEADVFWLVPPTPRHFACLARQQGYLHSLKLDIIKNARFLDSLLRTRENGIFINIGFLAFWLAERN